MKLLLVVMWMAVLLAASATEVQQITLASRSAMNLAQGIGGILTNTGTKDFLSSVGSFSSKLGPFLGGFGFALALFISFIPSDSAELAYMKEQFGIIKERLDTIDQSLDELNNAIEWNYYQTTFGTMESRIKSMYLGLLEIESYENWTTAAGHWQEEVVNHKIAGTQFYQGITSDSTFSDKLFMAAARLELEYDRTATQTFMMHCIELLTMAATIDISYLAIDATLEGRELQNLDTEVDIWATRMAEIEAEVAAADQYTVDQADSQLSVDVEAALSLVGDQSKQAFFNYLSDTLNEKYFWRDVFVVVYNPVSGEDNHRYYDCQSIQHCYKKFKTHNKNVIVIVEDMTYPVLVNSCSFPDIVDVVIDPLGFHNDVYRIYQAHEIYSRLPTCTGVTKMTFALDAYPIVYNGNRNNTPLRRANWRHYTAVIAYYFG